MKYKYSSMYTLLSRLHAVKQALSHATHVRYYVSLGAPLVNRSCLLQRRFTENKAITCAIRWASGSGKSRFEGEDLKRRNRSMLYVLLSVGFLSTGFAYLSVPLYRAFCAATGYAGTTQRVKADDLGHILENMERKKDRELKIVFEADSSKQLQWRFKPVQSEVRVVPGETALAFYTAENLTDDYVIGVSTYNVLPFDAGKYFNKIQCFCFEEQMLGPRETVDMPVFFFIDPEYDDDPLLDKYDEILLSYTFFKSKNQDGASGARLSSPAASGDSKQQHGNVREMPRIFSDHDADDEKESDDINNDESVSVHLPVDQDEHATNQSVNQSSDHSLVNGVEANRIIEENPS